MIRTRVPPSKELALECQPADASPIPSTPAVDAPASRARRTSRPAPHRQFGLTANSSALPAARSSPRCYGVLAPVAVSATVKVAPWHESLAALLIEIAFAMSTFVLPLAATSQPAPLLSCGEVTETLAVLQPL